MEQNENTQLIQIVQLPVIEERLRDVKSSWEQMTKDCVALVCTPEKVLDVKAKRADVTKQFNELETLRKAVKTQYMAAYDAFEDTYKDCITVPYKKADAALKAKIDSTEEEIKQACEDRLREYFTEACAANGVEFLRYEQLGIKVDMTSAKQKVPRKLMNAIKQAVERIAEDIAAIDGMGGRSEAVLVEYKRNGFDLARAVQTVREREEAAERERAAAQEREEARKRQEKAAARVDEAAALQAPTIQKRQEEPPKIDDTVYRCSFTVYATKEKLKKLKNFMVQEGIRHE